MGPDNQSVRLEAVESIATVTIDRPARRNALSLDLMQDLIVCLRAVGERADIAVAVLASEGEVFCSGHDLAEIAVADPGRLEQIFDTCVELMSTIRSLRQPVIARVQGVATAAGCQLVATCDLAVAAATARFATPGVRIGLFCSTPMVALSRAVPAKTALQMLLTGEYLSADDARSFGLVSRVVPAVDLESETFALARQVAAASRGVVAAGKAAFYRQLELSEAAAYAYTKRLMAENAARPDAREGISAFLAKRAPQWAQTPIDD